MTLDAAFWAGTVLAALAAAGCLYEVAAIAMVRRFFRSDRARASGCNGTSLLKPLHGAEPRLQENLASFLVQDYPGPLQMVCGVADSADPAVAAVERLRKTRPVTDIALVAGPGLACANRKIANLVHMLPTAKHDILIVSDSDMAAGTDYLSVVLGTLAQPGVGAVTCIYRGRGDAGIWSRLSAGSISYFALPGLIVAYTGALARPCMGSTIALKRETLEAIGGFGHFADVLADDYAIGAAVTKSGLRVVIPPLLLVHACREESFGALWRQKLRWSATIRGIAPLRHLGSIMAFPLPLALLAAIFLPAPGLPLVAASLLLRAVLALVVDARAGDRSASYWFLPAIECLEFLAFLASFATRKIDWRGSRLTMRENGRIAA